MQVVADYSLLALLALISVSLAMGMLPRLHPDWPPWLHWTVAVVAAVAFFTSVALHELSHAVAAVLHGMRVRRIRLFVFGGVTELEGEPKAPRAEFVMAVVGPTTSLAIGLASTWLGVALASIRAEAYLDDATRIFAGAGPLATVLLWLGPLNLALALFNMIPGFPLDGGRVLRSLLWWITGDLRRATRIASFLGQSVAWALMSFGVFVLFGYSPLGISRNPIEGLWFLLIGWFLNNAARTSYQQLLIKQVLENVPVRDLMRSRVKTVPPSISVAELVRTHLMESDEVALPVTERDHVLGIVGSEQVKRVPREGWERTRVQDVMVPTSELHLMAPDDDALDAVRHLAEHDPVPVVDHERLVGVARRQDVLKWLTIHSPRHVLAAMRKRGNLA